MSSFTHYRRVVLAALLALVAVGCIAASKAEAGYHMGCSGAKYGTAVGLREWYGNKWIYGTAKYVKCVRRINGQRLRTEWSFLSRRCYYSGYMTIWTSPGHPGYFRWWISPLGRQCW